MTPDTAPEAITQESDGGDINLAFEHPDRCYVEACADSLNIPDWQPNRQVWNDLCEVALRLTATTPRLTSHSAGEGLREVLLNAWPYVSDATMRGRIATVLRMTDVGYDPAASIAPTPPSDAGSTTRSGGEGDEAHRLACVLRIAQAYSDDHGEDMIRAANMLDRLVYLPAITTPSPDASPDSGEAESAREVLAHLREQERVGMFGKQGKIVTFGEAADVIDRLLAASPASLSGGAEEPVAYRHTMHMEGGQRQVRVNEWDGIDPDYPDRTAFGRAGRDYSAEYPVTTEPLFLHPSPEAAANRQEAGEVEALRHKLWMIACHATGGGIPKIEGIDRSINDICVQITAVRNEVFAHGKEVGAREALTSPKDVKGGGR